MTEPAQHAESVAAPAAGQGDVMCVGSMFTGIGGLDLGLERAGFRIRWQAEIDRYACRVLAKHWPDTPNIGDVKRIDWENDGLDYGDGIARSLHVDVVAAGFPCQPVSQVGKRAEREDPRWLWPEVVRCVRDLRPRYVLLENVAGLLTLGFGTVLADLAALGFDAEWSVLSACALGAPHARERLFVVAHRDGERLEEQRRAGAVHQGRLVRWEQPEQSGWWTVEPDVGRMVDGFPGRVDRLRGLGNAVVPQVAELVGRRLLAIEDERQRLLADPQLCCDMGAAHA